jgi:O-antigen/teichoic acid export membrane protein
VNRNLVTAFGAIAGSRLAIVLVLAVFSPLLVRLLGFETYGAYATVIAMFDLLMILVSSGVNSGVRKYIAEDRDIVD